MDLDELTTIFRDLGAPDPEEWAASQLEEGINQLGRFVFLKGAWQGVVDDDDPSWIDRVVEATPPGRSEPYDGVAHALRNLLAAGADRQDLHQLVRGTQAEAIFQLCSLLDDPGAIEGNEDLEWGLFEIDEDGEPGARIEGLHESVLELDPTGREMRPHPGA